MSDDASLDEFLGDESGDHAETGASAPADDGEATAAAEPAADIEPATTTYAWSGEGAACDECGETAERRWQQAGGLVCPGCKDWDRA
ncbi:DUF7573 domain-containing protein [Haloarcula laminariae]|uniref:DUF7573 domain-containing protein n=1 Tax=Haloarcula laminariae TaxID=2961577 RepID=UPI002404A92B|nr:hypothetical protein [Halomicroarcula sp. FL173]